MQQLDGQLVVSPTDLTRFLACRHLTRLDLEVARGERPRPEQEDETLEVLFRRGLEHEAAYLQRLRDEGRSVVEITVGSDGQDGRRAGRTELAEAERATEEAMAAGADVIYQATFFDGTWRGHADFLLKRPDRPGRWPWSYDVADTKLARRLKVPALLQMAAYGERLAILQDRDPEQLIVVTGDGQERPFWYAECAAYARLVRDQLLTEVRAPQPTVAVPVAHCDQCRWQTQCQAEWRAADDLSLVAWMRTDHRKALHEAGITTVRALAAQPLDRLPRSIGAPSRERLSQQARLQIRERDTGVPAYDLLPVEPGRGLSLLPEPSHGDVFFDIEGDPFVGDAGLEYLFGVVDSAVFTGYWATDPGAEQRAFEGLMDHLIAAWERDPDMHVYHYGHYELGRLKALSGRYGTRGAELDRLLRGQRLVDLYAVVRQGLRISRESYSIKKLEDFYWSSAVVGRARDEVSDAMGSVVAFERWLLDGDEGSLNDIGAYNESDCRSTQALRDWLEGLRVEAGINVRPEHADGAPPESVERAAAEVAALQQRLLVGVPEEGGDADQRARRLLAALLDWHRREALPEWWDHFRRLELTDEELVDDTAAVGQLGPPTREGTEKKSTIWRLEFPPQDTKLGPEEKQYVDSRTAASVGTVANISAEEGWLLLKRATSREAPDCTSLVPGTPIPARAQEDRLRDLAEQVLRDGVDGGGSALRAARDLLLRRPPRLTGIAPGEELRRPGQSGAAAVSRVALALDGGVLPVQGPPGSGKTYAGARMILDLLAAGRRVGICASSHKVVGNLLDEVATVAVQRRVPLRALQKAADHQRCTSALVDRTGDAKEVEKALEDGSVDLVAGTPWLFARAGMRERLDVLVVDEAGQLSLANTLAITGTARNLVLLGDPQQLAQPVKGVHPSGAEASALGHLLAGHATIPPDRGVFLDRTWRMHPSIAGFVSDISYDGRLGVADGLEQQRVASTSVLGGTGPRWVPVEHEGNSAASTEEAEVVRDLVEAVLADGVWVGSGGDRRRLEPSDVLVLAAYNAHVHRVRGALGALADDGVRVGTVDKYQGQEAPVVIFTMASSSVEDTPRGIDFLYSLHRFTVAVSRARAVTAVVASPRLLTPTIKRPDQLRLVNALCRFAATAEERTAARSCIDDSSAIDDFSTAESLAIHRSG